MVDVAATTRREVSEREAGEETPRPRIRKYGGCLRCKVTGTAIIENRVIVSPTGTAHYGVDGGMTRCGIDATGTKWWWPL